MADDLLNTLLRRADAAAGRPANPAGDLPGRVYRLAERHHRRVRAGGTFAATILAIGVMTVLNVSNKGARPSDAVVVDVDRVRAEIVRLRAEGDLRMEIVKRTLAIQRQRARLAELQRESAQPDPVRLARAQLEETASVLVYHADTLYRTPALRSSAIKSYQRAIELFPTTQSARLARARLATIEQNQGES